MTSRNVGRWLAVVAAAVLLAGGAVHAGLVAYYPLDAGSGSTAFDVVGGFNGALQPGAAWSTGRNGTGTGVTLNGATNSYINTAARASDLGIDGNKPKTVSLWAKVDGWADDGLFDVGSYSGQQDFCLRTVGSTTNRFRGQWWGGDDDFNVNGTDAAVPGGTQVKAADGNWVHYAVRYDGFETAIYADGRLVNSNQRQLNTGDSTTFHIGWYNNDNNTLIGTVDDVAVWDSALPYSSIAGLANETYTPLTAPLTAELPPAAPLTGVNARDVSGNGTLTSMSAAEAAVGSGMGTITDSSPSMMNWIDPDNSGGSGRLGGDLPFASDTGGDDQDFAVAARATVHIDVAGDYTFGYNSDDGSRLRVVGETFTSSTGVGGTYHRGDTLATPGLGGNQEALGVVHLAPGDYEVEYLYYERAGGARGEAFYTRGAKTEFGAGFLPVGRAMLPAGEKPVAQFDINNAAGSYTGTESPGHAAGDVSAQQDVWNTVTADAATGLVTGEGASANLRFDVGRSEYGRSTIDWAQTPGYTTCGANLPLYDNSLMRDYTYSSGNDMLAARVKGLEAGYYRVNALVREGNQLARTYNVNIGVNLDDIAETSPQAITDASGVTTWTSGKNYATKVVKVGGPSDWVTVLIDPTNAQWGCLQGLQIIPTDAPATSTYEMNNNVNDSTGPYDGTPVNGPTYQPSPHGGQALELNGSNQYVDLTNASNLGFQGDFTVSAWVKPDQVNGDRTIVGTDQGGGNQGLHLIIRDGKAHFGFYGNDTGGGRPIDTGEWQYLTWRYENGKQSIFVDGAEDRSGTGHAAFAGNDIVKIGRWLGGRYYDGQIDNLTITSRALQDTEIADQFRAAGGFVEDFEGTAGKLDYSNWYVGGGANIVRPRSHNNPGGAWGLETNGTNGDAERRLNVFDGGGGYDRPTNMTWGPMLEVLDDTKSLKFRLAGGNRTADLHDPRNGPVGMALWDLTTNDFVPGSFRTRSGVGGNFNFDTSIPLAGLAGKTVAPVVLDRYTGGWAWTGVDSMTASPGAVEISDNMHHKLYLQYHFDHENDFQGWTGDTDSFTIGNMGVAGAQPQGYIDLSGGFNDQKGFLSSGSAIGGHDGAQGTLRSPNFTVQGDIIEFLVGGGSTTDLGFELVRASDNTVLREARNVANANDMVYQYWNIRDLAGTEAYFRLRDQTSGGWAHIEVDAIRMLEFNAPDPMPMHTVTWGNATSTSLVHDVRNPGDLVLTTAGTDIQNYDDNGGAAFLNEKVSGTFSAVAHVSMDGPMPSNWAKMGIMLRESHADEADNYFVMATGSETPNLQWRDPTDLGTHYENTGGGDANNIWLKLERWENGQITAHWAPDSATVPTGGWVRFGGEPMSSFDVGLLGLAATSHNDQRVLDARFRGFAVNQVIDGFEGRGETVDPSRWYMSCGNNGTRPRDIDNPDGTYGLRTGNSHTASGVNIYNPNHDNATSMAWGPAFTVEDDSGMIAFKVIGGSHALNPTSQRSGGTGFALWDLDANDYVPGSFTPRSGNSASWEAHAISLAGLQGRTVMPVLVDRQVGGWAWTGVDSIVATAGAITFSDFLHHNVMFNYHFDDAGDFMGWQQVDGAGNPVPITSFQIGNTPGGLVARHINEKGVFTVGEGFLSSTTPSGGWDAPTGILRSPEFQIQGDIIEFLIGGGQSDNMALELWVDMEDNGQFSLQRWARHQANANEFDYEFWGIGDLNGLNAFLQLVDNNPGGWGHIEVDAIRMVDFNVPEPGTLALLGLGLAALLRRRRKA